MTFWCNQAMATCYHRWRAYYFELLAMRRSLGFWKNRALGAAWNTWVAWVEDLHRQRMSARNAVMRWRHMQLYSGFNTWRQILTDGILQERNASRSAALGW